MSDSKDAVQELLEALGRDAGLAEIGGAVEVQADGGLEVVVETEAGTARFRLPAAPPDDVVRMRVGIKLTKTLCALANGLIPADINVVIGTTIAIPLPGGHNMIVVLPGGMLASSRDEAEGLVQAMAAGLRTLADAIAGGKVGIETMPLKGDKVH